MPSCCPPPYTVQCLPFFVSWKFIYSDDSDPKHTYLYTLYLLDVFERKKENTKLGLSPDQCNNCSGSLY